MKKYLRTLAAPATALALSLCVTSVVPAQMAAAQAAAGAVAPLTVAPKTPAGENQKWFDIAEKDPRVEAVSVHSDAMGRDIPLALIPATDEAGQRVQNAPTIYLLNGAGGAEQNNDWLVLNPTVEGGNVGTIDFYSGKGVNVVIPMAGAFSYYLDWVDQPDGQYLQGPQKWETFLTKELPGPIESRLGANDSRALVGFSMSALPAMLLAEHNPGMYDAVAGFSGHYQTTSMIDHQLHGLTLQRGGASAAQMLGAPESPSARNADAVINAEGLRDTAIYVSNGSGLAGETDMAGYYINRGTDPTVASANAATLQVEGGVIEAATNVSTHNLDAKLRSLNIPATFNYRNTGTHSWPSWREDVHTSWPVLKAGLGL